MGKDNQKWKILCAVLAVLVIVEGVFAFISADNVRSLRQRLSELEVTGTQAAPADSFDPDAPAAEFRGGIVTAAEASEEYALLMPYYEMLGMNEAEYAGEAKLDVLEGLAEEKILENKAREYGVYELDETALAALEERARAEYEELIAYYMPFRFDDGKSDAEVRAETIAYLNENGDSYEELYARMEQNVWRDRLFAKVTDGLTVDDAQLREFYEEQMVSAEMIYSASFAEYESDCASGRAVLWHPEGVRRVQMLILPFDAAQAAQYADIQALLAAGDASRLNDLDGLYGELEAEGQAALARVQAGEDFSALMLEYGSANPDGECMSAQSSLYGDAVRNAAMALEAVGDTSGLVRCDSGLCILRYASDVAPGPVAFEEVAEGLRSGYIEEIKQSHYNKTVMQWLNEAEIQYYPERF